MAQDAGQQPGAPGGGGGGGGGGRWGNWETVAETQSDAEGKFELADVPVGNYLLFAGGRGIGMARQEIEIKAGETLQVELTLRPRQRDGGQQTPGQI
jgi:hypothetical protein